MKVLHLSDTPLSGAPIRIVELLNNHSQGKVQARHICWDLSTSSQPWRRYRTDMLGSEMQHDQLMHWLEWADVYHFHNRWARQKIFARLGLDRPKYKKSVIQIHSPRESESFAQELESKIPLAIVGQYHPRQWLNELTYIVPNVVDITHPEFKRNVPPLRPAPVISYAPSSTAGKGWDDKSYGDVAPLLKRMHLAQEIYFQLIIKQPYEKVVEMKRNADIGIDEISTGSYHLSSLEYLALGIPCFANVDKLTADIVKKMTGSTTLPWIVANKNTFKNMLLKLIKDQSWQDLGAQSRQWMELFWNPESLVEQYVEMYEDL